MTYLVDTNAIRELVRNNPIVVAHADSARQASGNIVHSVISKGEIHWGLKRLPQGRRRTALTQATNLILALMDPSVPMEKGLRIPDHDI